MRKEYLLDLDITDMPGPSAGVCSYIADHEGVRVKLAIAEVKGGAVNNRVDD